jgi:hypothetical protein
MRLRPRVATSFAACSQSRSPNCFRPAGQEQLIAGRSKIAKNSTLIAFVPIHEKGTGTQVLPKSTDKPVVHISNQGQCSGKPVWDSTAMD